MSKKSVKASSKKVAAKTESGRSWNRTYVFVKPLKAAPADDTIVGKVYAGIKTIKSGNADEVTAAAISKGLRDVTGQDPRVQTMVWLRKLVADGAVRVEAPEKGSAKKAAKTDKDAVIKAKKIVKKVVLKKAS
jgi:hypothetical protein